MTNQLRFADGDGPLRRYDYSDRTVFAADLGAGVEGSVDVVDGTVIVVRGGEQYEFEVPMGRAQAFIKNGVVTVEVSQ